MRELSAKEIDTVSGASTLSRSSGSSPTAEKSGNTERNTWDGSAYAMQARILRPLLWFGLLEYRSEKDPDSRFAARQYYRKSAIFDRLLAFDVKMDFAVAQRH